MVKQSNNQTNGLGTYQRTEYHFTVFSIHCTIINCSGESGSGKSVSRTNLLRTLLTQNSTLAEQCKQAQILLNPFITSKTITSPVSSRMGTQVSVQYAG